MLEALKEMVRRANCELVEQGLVLLTFGNVSGLDPESRLVAIKPSGVGYAELKADDVVLVDLDGKIVEGDLRPSSDTPTHLEIYKAFPGVGGVVHTHSAYATIYAQAGRAIPCLGTTHADHFRGEVPLTRALTDEEIAGEYEANTGRVIVERFEGMDALSMPAVLVAQHGPFTWGADPGHAVLNAVALEACAKMAWGAQALNPNVAAIPAALRDKHFLRKHGPDAYYGQKR